MRNLLVYSILAVLFVSCVSSSPAISPVRAAFEQVELGMTPSQVNALMGRPQQILSRRSVLHNGELATGYAYLDPLARENRYSVVIFRREKVVGWTRYGSAQNGALTGY